MPARQGVVLKPDNLETRFALQRLAREQCKERILRDVLFDMTVCQLEGWDKTEYIRELIDMLRGLLECENNG